MSILNRSTTRNKARLLSLSGDHAGAWLLAVPYVGPTSI